MRKDQDLIPFPFNFTLIFVLFCRGESLRSGPSSMIERQLYNEISMFFFFFFFNQQWCLFKCIS